MSEHIISAEEYREEPAYKQLLERYHIETCDDYAGVLKKMGQAVDEMLKMSPEERGEIDPIEKNNLEVLKKLLPICADLFIDCDPYYR